MSGGIHQARDKKMAADMTVITETITGKQFAHGVS